VIVTMTPLQVFSTLDGQRRFLAPFLPAPRVTRRDQGQADAPDHIIEAVVTEPIRAAADLNGPVLPKLRRAAKSRGG
jgi:hypothetical protein